MRFCPNMKMIMIAPHIAAPRVIDMVHVRCKQWSCPYCSPANGRMWRNHILTKLANAPFNRMSWCFITLTANETEHRQSPQATLRNLLRGWDRLRKRLRSWNGGAFEYVRVFERHPEGKYGGYHMHIIASVGDAYERKLAAFSAVLEREKIARVRGYRPRKRLMREKHPARWVRDNARECGIGFMTHIRFLGQDATKAALYETKYMMKQIEVLDFPKHKRRIQASRGIGKPRRSGGGGRVWQAKSAIYREDLLRYDKIIDLTAKKLVTEADFDNSQMWYPSELK